MLVSLLGSLCFLPFSQFLGNYLNTVTCIATALPLFLLGQVAIKQCVNTAEEITVVFPELQLYLSSHPHRSKRLHCMALSKRDVQFPGFKQ